MLFASPKTVGRLIGLSDCHKSVIYWNSSTDEPGGHPWLIAYSFCREFGYLQNKGTSLYKFSQTLDLE